MRCFDDLYGWKRLGGNCSHEYIIPIITRKIQGLSNAIKIPLKILDLGCGNGFVASKLAELGHSVIGVDSFPRGIEISRSLYPHVQFETCSIYDEGLVNAIPGLFDCVISVEVLEYLFYPIKLFEQGYRLLRPGGHIIVSTPYHGYLKNLIISLVDGWDLHFEVDCDGGHIKFFSKATCKRMASEAGFRNVKFEGVGRIPWLWKSIVLIAEK